MHESDSDSSDEPIVVRRPVKPKQPIKKAPSARPTPVKRLASARAPPKKVVDTLQ